MTVLLEIRQRDRILSQCAEGCYYNTGSACGCVCGGYNHGSGLEIARELTRRWAPFMVASFVECQDLDPERIQVFVLGEDWSLPRDLHDDIECRQRGPARVAHARPQDKGEGT
jgi:hypothetical protein